MRSLWRRLHRWCGLALAFFLFVNALSGSLIAFEHEIDAWLSPALFHTGSRGQPLDPDRLIAAVEQYDPRLRIVSLPLDARPGRSIEVQVAPRRDQSAAQPVKAVDFDRLFVDPVNGRILGQRRWGEVSLDRSQLMPLVNRLHRSMLLPGRWGNRILGGVAIGWLVLSLTGAYLTLPVRGGPRTSRSGAIQAKKNFWRRWWPAWQIKRGVRGARLAFDLHRAAGLWTAVVALLLGGTGMALNLGNEVVKPVIGLLSPVTPHPLSALPELVGPPGGPMLSAGDAVDLARAALARQASGFEPWYIGHEPRLGIYRVAFKEPELRERLGRVRYEQVYIDDRSGALRSLYGYDSGTAADRFLIWQYPVHSGKALGASGRLVVCASGVLVALLCGAGVYLWWLRRSSVRLSRVRDRCPG